MGHISPFCELKVARDYAFERKAENILEGLVRTFPLYNKSIPIFVKGTNKYLHACYNYPHNADFSGFTSAEFSLTKTSGFVYWFEISPNFRRKGYGAQLYDIVEKFSIEFGCTKMHTKSLKEATPFWERLGFAGGRRKDVYEKLL